MPESQRASAFARSETVLQLAWVVGGALGIALPPIGWIGFTVVAGLLVLAVGLVLWGRGRGRAAARPNRQPGPDAPPLPGTAVVVRRAAAPLAAAAVLAARPRPGRLLARRLRGRPR